MRDEDGRCPDCGTHHMGDPLCPAASDPPHPPPEPPRYVERLRQFVIYSHPKDYPDAPFVVREWLLEWDRGTDKPCVVKVSPKASFADTLELARQVVPAGLWNIGRSKMDPDDIVEVWT